MHETALMRNLLSIVEKAAEGEGGGRVRIVHLRIGAMAGVSPDALRFAFEVMSKGTVAEDGVLEIEEVPLSARCGRCGETFEPKDFAFVCGACGSTEIEIVTGREMAVDYIVTGDEEPDSAEPSGS